MDLGWQPFVKTWLTRLPKSFPEAAKIHLLGLFVISLGKGSDFIKQYRLGNDILCVLQITIDGGINCIQ